MERTGAASLRIDRQGAGPAPKRRRWLPWLVAALVALGAVAFLFMPRSTAVAVTPVVTSYPSQQFVVLNASGFVVAQRRAAIATKASGRLDWLGVREGSRVKEGELIARLDARDVDAQWQSAKAAVEVARAGIAQAEAEARDAASNLKRTRELSQQGFISPSAVDTAAARADRANATIDSAKAGLGASIANERGARVARDYTEIRAPFDGVVLSKSANVGDMVTPFSSAADSKGAVVAMADMSTLEVEADVSESSLSKIAIGQPVEIMLDALPDVRFRGSVARTVPTVDRAKATVMTKIRFDALDERVLPEMSAKVAFLSQTVTAEQQKPLLAVNPDAVVERGGRKVVFRVNDGVAEEVAVVAGRKLGDLIEVIGALKSGDKLVSKPGDKVAGGARVSIQAK